MHQWLNILGFSGRSFQQYLFLQYPAVKRNGNYQPVRFLVMQAMNTLYYKFNVANMLYNRTQKKCILSFPQCRQHSALFTFRRVSTTLFWQLGVFSDSAASAFVLSSLDVSDAESEVSYMIPSLFLSDLLSCSAISFGRISHIKAGDRRHSSMNVPSLINTRCISDDGGANCGL